MPVVTDYTALLSGSYWNGIEVTGKPAIITYSFPTMAPPYMASAAGFNSQTVSSFQAFDSAEQTEAQQALGEWAAASGLVFVQVAPGQGDINFQLANLNTTTAYTGAGGIGFYPFGYHDFATDPYFSSDLDAAGDVYMNTQYVSGGQVSYGTLLHEIGHAIGLKHPTETVTSAAGIVHDQVLASDDPSLTIMSQSIDTSNVTAHLKPLDMEAAAFIYGPAGTGEVVTGDASGSNSALSSWSWDASTETLTQYGLKKTDNVMRGVSVNDIMYGGSGNDQLYGLDGNDQLYGGAGNDFLDGGPGNDIMKGGSGDDTYVVDSTGDKVIEGANGGNDSVYAYISYTLPSNVELLQLFGDGLTGKGNGLNNTIYGDGGYGNTLYGEGGDDYIVGGSGDDHIYGGTGNNQLYGGAGNDVIHGGTGNDRLSGGPGVDQIYGGGGIDTFVLSATTADLDVIHDFLPSGDILEISAALFGGGLQPGALSSSQFESNTTGKATSAQTRFSYDTANGALFYDPNGSGAGRQHIATLSGAPALSASSFNIVS